ncbi:hypothetical protein PTKIN_Ptkin05aG0139300 [Pterospermum kingtungense]
MTHLPNMRGQNGLFPDESNPVIGPDLAIQGLDLVIKSFEEEILFSAQTSLSVMSSDSSESRPKLGFLLEASDDDIGAVRFGEMMGYEFLILIYKTLKLGIGSDLDANNNNINSDDFVALGGLFESTMDI